MAKKYITLSTTILLLLSSSVTALKKNSIQNQQLIQINYQDDKDVANEMDAYKQYNVDKFETKLTQAQSDSNDKEAQKKALKLAEEMDEDPNDIHHDDKPKVIKKSPEAPSAFAEVLGGTPYGDKVEKEPEQVASDEQQVQQEEQASQIAATASQGDKQYTIELSMVDQSYVGTLFVGTPHQPVRVIFDSGSEHFAISSDQCKDCETKAYAQTKSKSGKVLAQETKIIEYGTAQLEGKQIEDATCLQQNGPCVNFKFMSLVSGQGLPKQTDGILGLSPELSTDRSDQHFIYSLMNAGVISKASFSLNLAESRSYAVFGGVDFSQIVGGKTGLRPFRNNPDIFSHVKSWALAGKGIYYGGSQIGEPGSYPAIMDTGSNVLSVPPTLFAAVQSEWSKSVKDLDCKSDANFCQSQQKCDDLKGNLKNIGFLIASGNQATGETVFEIIPDQYLFQVQGGVCQFGIVENKLDKFNNKNFIFGQAFLTHFVSVYNYELEQISLGINVKSKDFVKMYSPGQMMAQESDPDEPKVVQV